MDDLFLLLAWCCILSAVFAIGAWIADHFGD